MKSKNRFLGAAFIALLAVAVAAYCPEALADSVLSGDDLVEDWDGFQIKSSYELVKFEGECYYRYCYEISGGDAVLKPGLSHIIIEMSPNVDFGKLIISNTLSDNLGSSLVVEGPKEWSGGQADPGFPGTPLYGIKFEGFDDPGDYDDVDLVKFCFLSKQVPMLGNFYAKGGRDSYAYNSGWTTQDGAKIWRPDTDSVHCVVPEPASMALLGLGIAGIGLQQYRRRSRNS